MTAEIDRAMILNPTKEALLLTQLRKCLFGMHPVIPKAKINQTTFGSWSLGKSRAVS